MLILQAIIDGILIGGFYALMAAGLTLVFGVMEIVNFAQGILVVLGAYLSYALYSHLHIDPFVGLLITLPAMFVVGVVIYWTMIKPIKGDRVIMSLLTMFAVGTVIEGILDLIFTSNLVQTTTSYVNSSVQVGSLIFPVIYLLSFAMAVVLLSALYWLLYRTRFGRNLRATTQNPTAARMVGHRRRPDLRLHPRHRGARWPRQAAWSSARPTPSTPPAPTTSSPGCWPSSSWAGSAASAGRWWLPS